MIGGDEAERDGSACLRQETHALALRCRNESPSIQHVLIDLRLLALQARQSGIVVRSAARQAVVWRIPTIQSRAEMPDVRLRIRLVMHCKPLARLVVGLLG